MKLSGWKLWAVVAAAGAALWWYLKRKQTAANANTTEGPKSGGGGSGIGAAANWSSPLDLIKNLGQNVLTGASRASPVTSALQSSMQAAAGANIDLNRLTNDVGNGLKSMLQSLNRLTNDVGNGLKSMLQSLLGKKDASTGIETDSSGWSNLQKAAYMAPVEAARANTLGFVNPFSGSYNPTGYDPAFTLPVFDPFYDGDSVDFFNMTVTADAAELGVTTEDWLTWLSMDSTAPTASESWSYPSDPFAGEW